ncbi:MAG: hypothetical protein ABI414_11205, partial [Devosia sp.]
VANPDGQNLASATVKVAGGTAADGVTPAANVAGTSILASYDSSTETLTLTDLGDRTLYRVVSRLDTVEERDGMLSSGMEYGAREGFERLDAILEDLKASA